MLVAIREASVSVRLAGAQSRLMEAMAIACCFRQAGGASGCQPRMSMDLTAAVFGIVTYICAVSFEPCRSIVTRRRPFKNGRAITVAVGGAKRGAPAGAT